MNPIIDKQPCMPRSDHSGNAPLVSYTLLAYNQERYVGAAIDSALAQTWPNLEIILSDDCSSDDTFTIMEAKQRDYHGPHTLYVNRNPSNFGIAAHINTVVRLSSGRLIIAAAGDDISKPERTEKIANEWERFHFKAVSFHSGYRDMAEDGTDLGLCVTRPARRSHTEKLIFSNPVVGATEAWAREIFDVFGPLNASVTHEDRNLAFRASLLGGVYFIPEALVMRRRGGISAGAHSSAHSARRRNAARYSCDVAQSLCDLHTAVSKKLIDEQQYAVLVAKLADRLAFEAIILQDTRLGSLARACAAEWFRTWRRIGFALYNAARVRLHS